MKRVYKTIAREGELSDGEGKLCELDEEKIALFYKEGQYYAISAVCPHQNMIIECKGLKGYNAICYHHYLGFDIRTGRCINASMYTIEMFEVKVEGGEIMVLVWED